MLNSDLDVPGIYVLYFESDDYQFYIGKSVNIRNRYKQHCNQLLSGKHKNKRLVSIYNIHKVLPSIGILEISEDLDNLFDKEIYWIKEFDSFNNGMNQTIGGEGVGSGENAPGALYTEEVYVSILKELTDVTASIESIAKKLNVSADVVSNISLGGSHTYLKVTHPDLWDKMISNIGKRTCAHYPISTYVDIVYLLADKISLLSVCEMLEVPYYIISSISKGVAHTYLKGMLPKEYTLMRKYAQAGYYLRKYSDEIYIEILDLLAHTDMTYTEIAEKTNTNIGVVSSISIGKAHSYLKLEFPTTYSIVESKRGERDHLDELPKKILRSFKHEESVYYNILVDLATTNNKLNVISIKYDVDEGIVEDISRGSTHKYLEVEYPELYKQMLAKKGKRRAGSQSGQPYPSVLDPQGVIHTNISNAKQFAIDYGLHQGHFGELLRGKAKSHKGWVLA